MKKLFACIAFGLLYSQSAIITTNQISGLNNVVHYGQYNKVNGKDNQILGYQNNIDGKGNAALGLGNQLKGDGNLVAGVGNSIKGKGNLVAGAGNIVIGPDASQQEKAIMNQRMLDMFNSRGLGGIIGISNTQSQISSGNNNHQSKNQGPSNADDRSRSIDQLSPSGAQIKQQNSQRKQQKTSSQKPVQIEIKQNPKQTSQQNLKVENSIVEQKPIKKQSAPQAYVIQHQQQHYDYNLADNSQTMADDDMFFTTDLKTPDEKIANQAKPSQITVAPNNTFNQVKSQKKEIQKQIQEPRNTENDNSEQKQSLQQAVKPYQPIKKQQTKQQQIVVEKPNIQQQKAPVQVKIQQNNVSVIAEQKRHSSKQQANQQSTGAKFNFYVHNDVSKQQKTNNSNSPVVTSRYNRNYNTQPSSNTPSSSNNANQKLQQSSKPQVVKADVPKSPYKNANLRQQSKGQLNTGNGPIKKLQQKKQVKVQNDNDKGTIKVIKSTSTIISQPQNKPGLSSADDKNLNISQKANQSNDSPSVQYSPVSNSNKNSNSQQTIISVASLSSSQNASDKRYKRSGNGLQGSQSSNIKSQDVIILSGDQTSTTYLRIDQSSNSKKKSSQVPIQYFNHY